MKMTFNHKNLNLKSCLQSLIFKVLGFFADWYKETLIQQIAQ